MTVTGKSISPNTFLGEPNKRHLRNKTRGPYTLTNPFPAPISAAHDLCRSGSRQFLHVNFDITRSTLSYETGDHLAVRPTNSNIEVDRFLRVLGLSEQRHVELELVSNDSTLRSSLPTLTTFDAIARCYLDICAPVTRECLAAIAPFAQSHNTKTTLSRLSSQPDDFRHQVTEPCLNLVQVLERFGDVSTWTKLPFSILLENIPAMKARYYSISSSPAVSKRTVSITTVVKDETILGNEENFKGVATNFLRSLSAPLLEDNIKNAVTPSTHQILGPRERYSQPTALISIRHSKFKMPRDTSIPIIMIGPGTGVAPFRGFVASRAKWYTEGISVGRTLLFYGCRKETEDFLYQNEWQQATKAMLPSTFSMYVAYSRDPARPKRYVQDLFSEHAAELRDLIVRENAHVYICGDARRMARDVFQRMTQIIAPDGRFVRDEEEARKYLVDMKSSGRWLEDVW